MTTLERQFAQTVAEQKSTIYTVCYMFSQDADEVNDLFQESIFGKVSRASSIAVTSRRGFIASP